MTLTNQFQKIIAAMVHSGRTGPIVAIHHMNRGPELLNLMTARLQKNDIFVSSREGYLRIALHGWHDHTDIDAVINALAQRSTAS